LLWGIIGRFDSDVSKGLATKAEQHNILSESITSQKISLVTEKHGNDRNQLDLIFEELKGLYTYLVITTSLMEIKPYKQ
jgi:hypothetical protein